MAGPPLSEIAASVQGAVRLLKRDTTGLSSFNMTPEGFWRSFYAIAFVLPISLLIELVLAPAESATVASQLMRSSANLCLQWVGFAALALILSRLFDLESRYMSLVTVYNWCSIVAAALVGLPTLFVVAGIFNLAAGQFIAFSASLFTLYYMWYVARSALQTTGMIAAAFVGLDFVLSLTVNQFFGLQ